MDNDFLIVPSLHTYLLEYLLYIQGYVYASFNTLTGALFIHSLHKYFLSTYNIPDTYLGTGNMAVNKAGNSLPSRPFQAGAHNLLSLCLELQPGLPKQGACERHSGLSTSKNYTPV